MKYKKVHVTITTTDGDVLEDFSLAHWKEVVRTLVADGVCEEYKDCECVGSPLSEAGFLNRFREWVEEG